MAWDSFGMTRSWRGLRDSNGEPSMIDEPSPVDAIGAWVQLTAQAYDRKRLALVKKITATGPP